MPHLAREARVDPAPGARRPRGAGRGGPRRRGRRLSTRRGAAQRSRRRGRRRGRADPASAACCHLAPRTRSNVRLEPSPGGRGDPELVPGPGLFAPPERIEARPFSATRGGRDRARDRDRRAPGARRAGALRAAARRDPRRPRPVRAAASPDRDGRARRAEPARLDRPGRRRPNDHGPAFEPLPGTLGAAARGGGSDRAPRPARACSRSPASRATRSSACSPWSTTSSGGRISDRVVEIEPGRWWLGDRRDREAAAIPLADRVEWAVYSLLSTAGPIAETAFFERVATLFSGHDLPDETARPRLPRQLPEPRLDRRAGSSTGEDLRRRTAEHTELLARLANGGHRLGHARLDRAARPGAARSATGPSPTSSTIASASRGSRPVSLVPKEDGEAVDCVWYRRGGSAFLFEVEWTAMLGDVLLRRHARIPPDDGSSASSRSRPSGATSPATSSSRRRCCARRWRPRTGT